MSSRFGAIERELREAIAATDVERMPSSSVRDFVRRMDVIERMAGGAKTVGIGELARKDAWNDGSARSAAEWVAKETGAGWGAAKAKVELGEGLRDRPATTEALLTGRISETQAALVSRGAAVDPHAEHHLLEMAQRTSVKELKAATDRIRATEAGALADQQAAVHRTRHLRHWIDSEGGFNIQARMTKAAGAKVLAALEPLMETEFADARRQGRRELPDAYRADALVTMAERAMRGHRGSKPAAGGRDAAVSASDAGSDGDGAGAVLVETACDCHVPASAHVIVRVDHAALLRGHVLPGEICEIDGIGSIPVTDAYGLMSDPFITALEVDGTKTRAASTTTRTVRKPLRLAVEARDRVCVVPGCGVANGLEIDHLIPYHLGGPTSLENVQRLCKYHHRLKTANKATLTRRETQDGPVFGWLPRTSEAEEPPPGAKRSSDRTGDVEPPGAERTLWTD